MRRYGWLIVTVGIAVGGVAMAARPTKRLSDEERGAQLYERHCVQCHGTTAAGDGPATAALVAKVPDLRGGKLTADTREAQARLVLDGKGAMPSFSTSFDRYDAHRVLRHMERISGGAGADAPVTEPPSAPE